MKTSHMRPRHVVAAAAAVAALTACEPGAPDVAVIQPAPPGAVVTTSALLTPANVAAVVVEANQAMIERAMVARSDAADARVRAFADRVLRDSKEAERRIEQGLFLMGITPQPEAIAYQIESNAAQTVTALRRADGLEVDRLYLESEIANHRWLIGTIDAVMPTLTSSEARQELSAMRSMLSARLAEAERLEIEVFGHNRHHYPNH
ncbi:MAG TPA: DUF4142 domain-containing protein [Longimicrobiales bacterium]|nr:DUF4142 domain-containing protein [Longimicrobiales bacterium]